MNDISNLLPRLLQSVAKEIDENAESVTKLDQQLGDGDHVVNLQRGIDAVIAQQASLVQQEWGAAIQKLGMILLSKMGGASGSLYGSLFMALGNNLGSQAPNLENLAAAYEQAVGMVKKRGKSDAGEKTMLDVLIPVSNALQQAVADSEAPAECLAKIAAAAEAGMLATRDMLATKGRASFLGERSLGHIDAGAKTSQLIICAIVKELQQ